MKGRRVSARATELFYGCMRYYYDGGKAIALLLCSPFCLVSGILDPPFSFLLVGISAGILLELLVAVTATLMN